MSKSQTTFGNHPSIPYVNEFDKETVEKLLEGVHDGDEAAQSSKELDFPKGLSFDELGSNKSLLKSSDSGISSQEESIEHRPENIVPLPAEIDGMKGIGIYASCHGKIPDPSKHLKIPDELLFIKKNVSECGHFSYKLKRHPTMTPAKIVRRLEESLDPAFNAEECASYGSWNKINAQGNPLSANGNPIRLKTLTCPEFNTTTNQMKSFLYKQYYGESDLKRVRGVFVSYAGSMVNLFTVTMDELIDVFDIHHLTDLYPNPEKIHSILAEIQTYIDRRDTHKFISTDFIICVVMLLHNVYNVSVVRFLDESCNISRYFGPFYNPGGNTGFGGRKSHKRKQKSKRKSKKI